MVDDTDDEASPHKSKPLLLQRLDGETDEQALARALLDPCTRHGFVSMPFVSGMMGKSLPLPGPTDFVDRFKSIADQAEAGDMSSVSRMLAAQAVTLDTIFGEFARRSASNLGSYPDAVERYARLALKAQSNARATLEALAKLHQPREQIVRHVHVNEGGQAIVAEQVNHYAGGVENAETVKQSHTTAAAGECHPLQSQDQERQRVPVPGRQGQEAVPDARRHKPRRAKG
jgi:hypothetical protein